MSLEAGGSLCAVALRTQWKVLLHFFILILGLPVWPDPVASAHWRVCALWCEGFICAPRVPESQKLVPLSGHRCLAYQVI